VSTIREPAGPFPLADTLSSSADLRGLQPLLEEHRPAPRQAGTRRLWRDDVLTAAEYRTTRAELEERLGAVEAQQRAVAGRDPLAGIAGRANAAEVWKRLDLGRQRAILKALLVVTVLPQRLGRLPDGSRFDPNAVRIEPAAPPARH
jgi:hypothetical protein